MTPGHSAALVRQSFRNADAEKHPRGGLEVLSGRFSRGCLPRAEAPTPQSLRRGHSMAVNRLQDAGAPKRSEGGLGCSVFALRARAECPRPLQATPLQSQRNRFLIRKSWLEKNNRLLFFILLILLHVYMQVQFRDRSQAAIILGARVIMRIRSPYSLFRGCCCRRNS
jgi:hypothetical protein